MQKKILTGFVAALMVTVASFAAAPAHLKYVAMYDSEPWTMQGWCNFSFSSDLTLVNDGAKRGMEGFVDVGHVFLRETWNGPGGSWSGFALAADYQSCWKAFANLIAPAVTNGYVKGFMILDEPVWNGISVADLGTICTAIKTSFPNAITMVVEAEPAITAGHDILNEPVNYNPIPASVDWIGFDHYTSVATVKSEYQNTLYSYMNANQRAILVPQAYGSNLVAGKTLAQWDAEMVAYAQQYYDWAKTDTKIIGIVPWHWLTLDEQWWVDGCTYEIGARDMAGLNAKWHQIGAEIIANQPVTPKTTDMQFIQTFEGFSNGEILPSTYTADPWGANQFVAPPTTQIAFSTNRSVVMPGASIYMKNITGSSGFRYCWGTNSQNPGRGWKGHTVQYFQLSVYIDTTKMPVMDVTPYKASSKVFDLGFGTGGLSFADGKSSNIVAGMDKIVNNAWNKVKVKVDMVSFDKNDDNKVTIWLNDAVVYDELFTSNAEVAFDNLGFYKSAGQCYLDNIGMWGEIGCGEWGYYEGDLNYDCKVDLGDTSVLAVNWLNCTAPDNEDCVNLME